MADPVIDSNRLNGHEAVVFVHIPKSKGSTLNAIIDANVDPALIAQVDSPVEEQVMASRARWRVNVSAKFGSFAGAEQ